ncbi:MAG: hypothetical protein E6Q60_10420 [Nitrosomonas oligotropha]|uniref:Carbon-nitrogen hydrolase family protein n=1 Tax=Nitrosomonas oligotropha TaxID=42354 RepID=A0A5C7VQ09_9PROT|nr:MAG: hypothetical protein E6Q60_10420 [Nitrosomonas oligotropha]
MSYTKISIGSHETDLHKMLRVAVGHMAVNPEDIEKSYLEIPNTSLKRLKKLSQLLNDVLRHGVHHPEQRIHLLVLPEVSVPYSFATFLTRWVREHQIGIICGLEHCVRSRVAWNELLAVLPYRARNGTKACVPIRRLKKHYSPAEEFELLNHGLEIPKKDDPKITYQLFQWRGASFAVYNCFELACLEDRAIFKAKVDFIVCSEFNQDVNYFSSIVESAARDLHCYVIQVNSAQFGDSRVVSPSKTEKLNPLRIKGGDNQTFLTMELPLQKLRAHQRKEYGLQKDSEEYKPTPPGFDRKYVNERIRLGQKKKTV